jgi:predicted amino acid racemase
VPPRIVLDAGALAENARRLKRWGADRGVGLMAVLKAVRGFGPAVETLLAEGFESFGLAGPLEDPQGLIPRRGRTLIQLTTPRAAPRVAAGFARSLQSSPETLKALDRAAGAAGLTHEVVLMVNLGDGREGLEPGDVAEALDLALSLKSLAVKGFGAIMTCLGDQLPGPGLFGDLGALVELAAARGLRDPVLSLGGSVMLAFVDAEGPGPITELRLGDPLLLGTDVYRWADLPSGPWRRDVCRLEAEVVEVLSRPGPCGRATRALVDLGRFHVGTVRLDGSGFNAYDGLECLLDGAVIVGATSGYLVLDVSAAPEPPAVGGTVAFRPGYWAMAQAFRSAEVEALADRAPGGAPDAPS